MSTFVGDDNSNSTLDFDDKASSKVISISYTFSSHPSKWILAIDNDDMYIMVNKKLWFWTFAY